ncbi:flagellar protein FlaG [Paenibacillus zanthoxyli]|uniref:flagellar protein FlaG n=1 Tax=Paenibacillus zanthoxyli TaxID=369399 RepID=UPI0004709B64|nr:flagellar protein FlaG [Paenibacillus zanthoxyli]
MKPINSLSGLSPVAAVPAIANTRNETKPSSDSTPEILPAAAQMNGSGEPSSSQKAIMELQKTIDAIQGPQRLMEISIHKETHAVMIKVKNKETGELIREVPPEKILDAVAKMMEVTGLIVDKKI